jgi:hypothetical protein
VSRICTAPKAVGRPGGWPRIPFPDSELLQKKILGTNDMDAVPNSLAITYRWICQLDIDYDLTSFGTGRLTAASLGTGILISPCPSSLPAGHPFRMVVAFAFAAVIPQAGGSLPQ